MSFDRIRFPVALPLPELVDVTGTAWTCRLCHFVGPLNGNQTALPAALAHVEAEHHGHPVTPVIPLDGADSGGPPAVVPGDDFIDTALRLRPGK